MASELRFNDADNPGRTDYYAVLLVGASLVKASDGSPESLTSGHWPDGKVGFSDANHAGIYLASVPAGTPAGDYVYSVRQQAGLNADIADAELAVGTVAWDGAAEVTLSGIKALAGSGIAIEGISTSASDL